ncbi:MAG: ABC transporter ATP-binding protein [Clostridia bacterium]|nr:ABC transporter ATP-binding protein [Clostridia bacterium]
MKRRFKYTLRELAGRLMRIAAPQAKNIAWATLGSIVGNVARMTLMGTGAGLILCYAGLMGGSPWLWGAMLALSAVTIAGMRYLEGVTAHVAAYTLLADMRTRFFHKLRELSPACLVDRERGDIISIAIADIDTIEKFFAHTIGPMFTVILLPLLTLIYAATIRWQLALTLLPVYIVISVVVPLVAMRAGRAMGARYRGQLGEMKSLILESVYGLKDIQIFGIGPERLEMLRDKSREINRTAHGMTLHKQFVQAVPHFFIYMARILIVFVASWLALSETRDLTAVIILSFIVSASFSSTQSLISVVTSLLETFAAAERLFEIEDETPAVTEATEAVALDAVGDIRFEDVSFRYKRDARLVLDRADMTIRRGEKIGIVGPSGMGKSTVLRLLMRFWDPTTGAIRLDDTPLDRARLDSLRDRIALVEQHTFIYDDTAANNIALGKPDATMEEIKTAARRAGIANLIERLPDGYDTQLGEFGSHLSGGERQRVGIARVMLTDPDVIVMDEPTSSLDVFHEKVLLDTLEREYADKTIVIVSHRKSTLTGCDRVLCIENGRLHEMGPDASSMWSSISPTN